MSIQVIDSMHWFIQRAIRLSCDFSRAAVVVVLLGSWAMNSGAIQEPATGASIEELWNEAALAQQAQQFDRAASLYRRILAKKPDLTEAEVNLGLVLHLAGNMKDAIACFEHVLAYHPDLFAPNFLTGMDYLKLDNPARAIPYLEKANKEKPDQEESLVGLANAYLQIGRFSAALEQFTRATTANGKNADAWYGLGATYLSIEKQIEGDLRRTSSPFRAVLLGESYLQQGQAEKAVAVLSASSAAQPVVPCARSILGFALLQTARLEDAARQFQLDWDSQSSEGCLLAKLGTAALDADRGETQDALRELREAAEIDPAFVQSNSDWYRGAMVKAGMESQAREIFDGTHPGDSPAGRLVSASGMMKKGRYSACSVALAISHSSESIENLRLESLCSFYAGRDDQVLGATQEILKRSPADPEALYWRVQSMEREGLAALTRATELNPQSASLHALMGDMLRTKGDPVEAASEYRRAIAAKPDFIAAHLGLARVLYSDHRADDAEHEVQYVLTASLNDPEANYLMGEILLNRRASAEALPFLLTALHVSPEELPYVHADLGTVYEDRGDLERAIAEMKLAAPVDVDGSYHYRLGHLYMKSGNRAAANEALNQAAKLRQATDASALFQK
jgi:tetratricopeptide (TPR) repeat protein